MKHVFVVPFRIGILSVLLILGSCSSTDFTFSNYHCNLVIDNSIHLDPTLASAMNPASKGVYCHISYTLHGGAKFYVFTNNLGDMSESIFNAMDERRGSHLHIGQNNGLIVGYSTFSDTFFAYDSECPDCFDYNAIPMRSYPLSVSSTGIATCAHCHRTFNLNNEGNGLIRYRATAASPQGMLQVY